MSVRVVLDFLNQLSNAGTLQLLHDVLQVHLVVRRYVYQVVLIDREFAQLGFLRQIFLSCNHARRDIRLP